MKPFPFLALAAIGTSVSAFQLSGTVYQEGTRVPLAGASVSLAGRPAIAVATTNALGKFLLTDAVLGTTPSGPKTLRGSFSRGQFVVRGAAAGLARLEVISPDGRLVARCEATPEVSGELRFSLPSEGAQGLLILRLRQGSLAAVWTSVRPTGAGAVLAATAYGVGTRSLVDSPVDTLVVTKPGMKDLRLALPAGAGTSVTELATPASLMSTTRGRQRFIPEGRFLMGDFALPEARPPIYRSVQAFWIDTILPSRAELRALGFLQPYGVDSAPGEGNWMRAVRYCNLRSAAEGLPEAYLLTADSASWTVRPGAVGYRLPTEAEWEYAARAGTTTGWYWGDDSSVATASKYAAYASTTQGNPIPSASLKPNGFGLYDMAGNSWQWTEDVYGAYALDDMQPIPLRGTYGYERVMRGGAWMSPALELRSAYRKHDLPLSPAYIGVRCVRTAFPDTAKPNWSTYATEHGQRRIPGGTFQMGDVSQDSAQPLHNAKVGDLWVDTTLVPGSDFVKVSGLPTYTDSTRPADVSWHKAVRYCNARSLRDGLQPVYVLGADSSAWNADTTKNGYRLPTETEWEYLARAGTTTAWWWGNDSSWDILSARAWWGGNTAGNCQPVAQKLPNAFGLYDMVGNNFQWTEDVWGTYTVDGSPSAPLPQQFSTHRVYRGGAWFSPAQFLRSGWRKHDMPLASGYIGFRCVRTVR